LAAPSGLGLGLVLASSGTHRGIARPLADGSSLAMFRTLVFGAGETEVTVRGQGPRYDIARGDRLEQADVAVLPDGRLSLILSDGRQISGRMRRLSSNEVEVSTARGRRRLTVTDPLRARLSSVLEHVAA